MCEYGQVVLGDGSRRVRPDAAVNAANALCSLAELIAEGSSGIGISGRLNQDPEAAQRACQALDQARILYHSAIESSSSGDEDDADTWSNLADCLVQYAQLLAEEGPLTSRRPEVPGMCEEALRAYERSCSLSDSSQGDDLPGLLCNWGSGLLAIAQMTQPPQVMMIGATADPPP